MAVEQLLPQYHLGYSENRTDLTIQLLGLRLIWETFVTGRCPCGQVPPLSHAQLALNSLLMELCNLHIMEH